MPQMDSVTFLPQVFWLLVVFSTFYLIVADKVLPTMSRILKTRSKKLSQGKEISNLATSEEEKLLNASSEIFVKSSKKAQSLMQELSSETNAWQSAQVKPLNGQGAGISKEFNKAYFLFLSEKIANQERLSRFI